MEKVRSFFPKTRMIEFLNYWYNAICSDLQSSGISVLLNSQSDPLIRDKVISLILSIIERVNIQWVISRYLL